MIVPRTSLVGFLRVHPAFAELVHAAAMIGMSVGCNCEQVAAKQIRGRSPQACHSKPGIHQQIGIAAADVPDIAAEQRMHVGLPEERHVPDTSPLEPGFRRCGISLGHFTIFAWPDAAVRPAVMSASSSKSS